MGPSQINCAEQARTLSAKEKTKVLTLFLVILAICLVPQLVARRIIVHHYLPAIALSAIGVFLFFCIPIIAAKWKPTLAGFDQQWLPPRWSHLLWWLLLLVGLSVWALITYYVINQLGFWVEGPHFGQLTLEEPSPVAILFRAAIVILAAPIAEEIFWRGYALEQFRKLVPGTVAVLLQAVLFAFCHLYPVGPSILVFGYGMILGFWRLRMRSLVPIIIVHIALNTISLLPLRYRDYQQAVAWEETIEQLTDQDADHGMQGPYRKLLDEIFADFREAQGTPEARQIDSLARKPMRIAVPRMIEFLAHDSQNIRDYASVNLVVRYRTKASPYYERALDSENSLIVEEVLGLIGLAKCEGLTAKVRAVIRNCDSKRVRICGLLALKELGDTDGIRQIADHDPSEKIRRFARSILKETQATQGPGAPLSQPAAARPQQAQE